MGSLAGILFSLWLISGIRAQEINVLDMMPNTFDDQYIGCEDEMEREMPKILEEELKYDQFKEMWEEASQAWKRDGLSLPSEFHDNYGIAVVLYTMEEPHPIYSQLNGNVSIKGESRDLYMNDFHFKALHFYLTRALQVLRTGCAKRSQVYRGTTIDNVNVAKELRFGRFTSTSKNITTAKDFGTNPFFNISTCYGVDIANLSDIKEEQEYLIPVAETFNMTNQIGTTYQLESTGKLCSYFNCAYLGGEKRSSPVCTSDPSGFPNSGPRTSGIPREGAGGQSAPGTTIWGGVRSLRDVKCWMIRRGDRSTEQVPLYFPSLVNIPAVRKMAAACLPCHPISQAVPRGSSISLEAAGVRGRSRGCGFLLHSSQRLIHRPIHQLKERTQQPRVSASPTMLRRKIQQMCAQWRDPDVFITCCCSSSALPSHHF